MRHCSNCFIEYNDDTNFCSRCGNTLADGHIRFVCPTCNKDLGADYKQFCPHCGQQFNQESTNLSNNETQVSKGSSSSKKGLVIAFSVLTILTGCYFGFKQDLINAGFVNPNSAEEHYNYSLYLEKNSNDDYMVQLIIAADKGHKEALYRAGAMAVSSEDYDRAIKWLSKAESLGHVKGASLLGVCYYDGLGVDKNFEKALSLFEKAANNGEEFAAHQAGYMYCNGQGTVRNVKKGIPLLEMAANGSLNAIAAAAQLDLGRVYFQDVYNNKDGEKAVYWFKKAYENGKLTPLFYLGRIYEEDPLIKDYNEAVKWYRLGVKEDIDLCILSLAMAYHYGKGVPQDEETALYWLGKYSSPKVKFSDLLKNGM